MRVWKRLKIGARNDNRVIFVNTDFSWHAQKPQFSKSFALVLSSLDLEDEERI